MYIYVKLYQGFKSGEFGSILLLLWYQYIFFYKDSFGIR